MKFKPRTRPPWRLLFLGTDLFSLTTLETLQQHTVQAQASGALISHLHLALPQSKKPNVVEKWASACGLKQLSWPLDVTLVREQYDVAVLASFGHLIPQKIIELFPYGILNVHPSALPRWRGAAPLHHTILSGDLHTGVSIMSIEPRRFDHGQILAQKPVVLPARPTLSTVRDQLGQEGGRMIVQALKNLPETFGNRRDQSSEGVSYAHKITKDNSWIDWESQTVGQVDRQYRALSESVPLRSEFNGATVALMEMCDPDLRPLVPLDLDCKAGLPVFDKSNNVVWVKCTDGWAAFARIVIKKKKNSAKDFFNGYLSKKHLQGLCFTSHKNNLFDENYLQRISNPRPS